MRKTVAAIAITLLLASRSWAFSWAWDGAETEPLQSTNASCAKTDNNGGGADGDHSFITMNCDDTTTEGFVVHFHRPYGFGALTPVAITLTAQSAAIGLVCTEVVIGCADSGSAMTWGTAVRTSRAFGTADYWFSDLSFPVTFPNNLYSYCAVRVRRVHGDGACGDTAVGDVKYRDGVAD